MAFVLNDRVKETTTTTGTGTVNLGGAASGFDTFVAGIGNSNVTYYCIAGQTNAEFEVGIGTVTDASPDTLSRTTILSSSNSDNAVDFSAGTKDVFCTLPASKAVVEDTSSNVTLPGTIAATSATFTTADNNPQLTLISTDADANVGPVLNLYRNSASPADGDVLGRILFKGEDDAGNDATFARIEATATDVSNGSENAKMEFIVAINDTFNPSLTLEDTGAATFAGTITANAGVVVDELTIDADTITATDDFIIDAVGDITLDAADNQIFFKDAGTTVGTVTMTGSDLKIISNVNDKDMIFAGTDNNSEVVALTLDMSNAGRANFNNDIGLNDDRGVRFGSDDDSVIYNDGSNLYIKNGTLNQDIIFQGNDDGSAITALTLDMSDAGTATFNHDVKLPDNGILAIGDGGDLQLTHNNSNGTITNSTGNLLLDVAGDITLDADGGDIKFQDSGTDIFSIINSSSDVQLKAAVQDKDMIFRGNDGGSTITALTLDMSQAGEADFNSAVKVAGGIVAHQTNRGVLEYASNFFKLRSYGATAGSGSFVIHVGGGGGSADSEALRIDSSGRVGIGTTSASSYYADNLVVSSDDDSGITLASSATTHKAFLAFADGTSGAEAYQGYLAYDHNNNSLQLGTSGSERARIDASGNVGIGTTSMDSNLHIVDGTTQVNIEATTGDATLKLECTGENYWNIFNDTSDSNKLKFEDNGNGVLTTIDRNGNVGIGTTSPDDKLHIEGTDTSTSDTFGLKITNFSFTSGTTAGILFENADNHNAYIRSLRSGSSSGILTFGTNTGGGIAESNISERMRIDGSGNVGIGTASPSKLLHIKSADPVIRLEDSSPSAYAEIDGAGGDLIISCDAGNDDANSVMQFKVDNSERMRINDAGDVLIGGTQEYNTLNGRGNLVVGSGSGNEGITIVTGTSNTGGITFADGTSGDAAYRGQIEYRHDLDAFLFTTAATERMRIDSSGNVAIGDTSPAEKLEVAGNILASGSDGTARSLTLGNTSGNHSSISVDGSGHLNLDAETAGGLLLFKTAGTERMRINSAGITTFGTTGASPVFNNQSGVSIGDNNGSTVVGVGQFSASSAVAGRFNRTNEDGVIIAIHQAGTQEGTISVSGSTVSYNGFSGNHETSGIASDTPIGTVCSTIDELDTYLSGSKEGQTRADHAKIKVSDAVGDTRVYGVLTNFDREIDNKPIVASVGIGSILVTGSCVGGDLLESNGDGTAKVQDDDIIRSKTIGKVTIGNSTSSVKLVSCVLYCG